MKYLFISLIIYSIVVAQPDIDEQFQTLSNQYPKQFFVFNPLVGTSLGYQKHYSLRK
tara:strand:+ start:4981 stop:5151 length:171 start_codon:yes stop_codon:yes gene_type:complete